MFCARSTVNPAYDRQMLLEGMKSQVTQLQELVWYLEADGASGTGDYRFCATQLRSIARQLMWWHTVGLQLEELYRVDVPRAVVRGGEPIVGHSV